MRWVDSVQQHAQPQLLSIGQQGPHTVYKATAMREVPPNLSGTLHITGFSCLAARLGDGYTLALHTLHPFPFYPNTPQLRFFHVNIT